MATKTGREAQKLSVCIPRYLGMVPRLFVDLPILFMDLPMLLVCSLKPLGSIPTKIGNGEKLLRRAKTFREFTNNAGVVLI